FKASVGPLTKTAVGGGGYNQFTPDVSIRTTMPVLLESALLYVGNSGRVKFTVISSLGAEVSSVTLDVTATRSIPAAGVQANDPADPGKRYLLNLRFPTAGNYVLHVDYLDGATLFRNNTGGTSYPYSTPLGMFSITGNTVATPNDPSTFYYYLYNLQVQSLGCAAVARIEVPVIKPVISNTDNILSINLAGTYQWYLNGNAVAGATSAQYKPLVNGTYLVDVVLETGCTLRSDALAVNTIAVRSIAETLDLKIYPVPSQKDITIAFTLSTPDRFEIRLSNLIGQQVYSESRDNYLGLFTTKPDLSRLAAGVYTVTITVGSQHYSRKIVLIR
ncbi:MAG: T9SS type A sorting domain-containing protein, partial [Pedobacter sp.]